MRGKADDGHDLVISRDYMSQGFRLRAAERVELELGPRSEKEIRAGLEKEVEAERWTSLDRALRNIADESAGIVDLRPDAGGKRTQSFATCSSAVRPSSNAWALPSRSGRRNGA